MANPYLRAFGKTWMKPLTLIALIAPFAYLAALWTLMLTNTDPYIMGFNPVQWTHHYLGDTAIQSSPNNRSNRTSGHAVTRYEIPLCDHANESGT